jgi:hypothetical protein
VGLAVGRSDRLHFRCDTDHHFDLQSALRSITKSAGAITVLSPYGIDLVLAAMLCLDLPPFAMTLSSSSRMNGASF